MHISIISDSLTAITGFGKQTRLLAKEFFRRGHRVTVVARPYKKWQCSDPGNGPVEVQVPDYFSVASVSEVVQRIDPDVVFIFRNSRFLKLFIGSSLFEKYRTFLWYADENEAPILADLSETEGFPDHTIIPVSRAVASCVLPTRIAGVVHHGFDFEELPKFQSKADLRSKWAGLLNEEISSDDILLICAERNDVRKNWEAVYAVYAGVRKALRDQRKRLRLIQVTRATEEEPYYNLALCAKLHSVSGTIIDLAKRCADLSDHELFELLLLSDLRLSCAGAEGFGLLSLESAALRVPQVVVRLGALEEFLGTGNGSLVDPCRIALYPEDKFYYSNKGYAVPDIAAMVERVMKMLTDSDFRKKTLEDSYGEAKRVCSADRIADRLLDIISA